MTVAGAWLIIRVRRWRRKSPGEIERQRRWGLNRHGRITAGHILEVVEPDRSRKLILFQYEVAGVSYEAAQDISALPGLASNTHGLAGQAASVKYDPKQPTNSIVACEDWSGIKVIESLTH